LGLFGSKFTEGNLVLIILVIGQLVNASTGSVGVLLNMSGNQKIYRRAILTVISIYIVTSPIATYFFGMLGTAATTSFCVILINVWLVFSVKKKLNLRASYPF
jgi:O-antigen/teichoic acid export membrane protein